MPVWKNRLEVVLNAYTRILDFQNTYGLPRPSGTLRDFHEKPTDPWIFVCRYPLAFGMLPFR